LLEREEMKVKGKGPEFVEIDYTPMIDMTFQLVAFFMILINFEASEQDERVQLPSSVLAKPPQSPFETPITIQMVRTGGILMGGQVYADADAIKPLLNNEKYVLETQQKDVKNATIIIRAHKDAKTGQVQEVIKVCQEVGFEKFTLRAKSETGY
jgi:biopolymer transport protein ExbD